MKTSHYSEVTTAQKALSWIPYFGVLVEVWFGVFRNRHYLANSARSAVFWVSGLWHGLLTMALIDRLL